MILIGTKADLKSRRMVSEDAIRNYAEANKLTYLETSSKTNENVEKCFVEFTRILVSHTNQMELEHKINKPGVLSIDPKLGGKRVNAPADGICAGGKCTI